ncbi:MAG: hypothetical protein KC931_14160, partial [Candidatus Omnitrophica bacterium]|nr:hypothetical protein [Candidatus Omnitrophota bacterium]
MAATNLPTGALGTEAPFERPHEPEALSLPTGERQLFLDDHLIAKTEDLKRTLHQPDKKGAVIVPDRPWEVSLQTRCAPAWDPEQGLYKLWLITSTRISDDAGATYAESQDGVHWTKPNLGQREIEGSLENNFVALDPAMKWPENAIENVVYDGEDPNPSRRFKGFLGCYDREPIFSRDGIHWSRPGLPKIPSQDESNLSYDLRTRTFIATLKQTGPFGRSHGLSTSRDFLAWTTPELVFHADEEDQVRAKQNIEERLANSKLAPPLDVDPTAYKADIYNLPIFRYEGLYLALPSVFHTTYLGSEWDDGFHLIQLACSRDLHQWTRVGDRQTFIGPSNKGIGAYDTMQILPPSAPVMHGDEMWFYYTGIKYRSMPKDPDPTSGAVCLATLRRDGFLSLDAGDGPGSLITKPFTTTGRTIHVNVDSGTGSLIIEVLNEEGSPIAESHAIIGDFS